MEQADLRSYLRPVLKRWWLILAVVPLVTVATYLHFDDKPKVYQASTELYFAPSTLRQLIFGTRMDSQEKVENSALLIETDDVARRAEAIMAAEDGGGQPIPSGYVAAQALEKTSFIVVTGTAGAPGAAARLANSYAAAFVALQREAARREARQVVRASKKQLKQIPENEETLRRREALETKIQDLQLVANQPRSGGGVTQLDLAVPPAAPIDHDPRKNAIFAFVIALMLSVAAAYGLEYLNRRIVRVEEVEELYGLPVLTEIPKVDAPAPSGAQGAVVPPSLVAPFQRLQLNLEMLRRQQPLKTILVVSAAPDEGKSVVARNLGLAFSEAGHDVAVLDADLRKASLGGLLAVNGQLGLSDVLAGRATFGQVVQEVPLQNGGNGHGAAGASGRRFSRGELGMVTAGERQGSLSQALASETMRETLRAATDAFGIAIVDSPPLLAVADALPLLSEADAVVVVTRLGVSTRDSARRLMRELGRVPNVSVAGIVVNAVPRRVFRSRSYGYDDG